MSNEFKAALEKARQELAEVEKHERQLASRKAQLMHSIAGLSALLGEIPSVANMTLADAIRVVLQNYRKIKPEAGLRPTEIRDQLRGIGFDLAQFNNEMASIGTAIRRMRESGEVEPVGDAELGGVRWRDPLSRLIFQVSDFAQTMAQAANVVPANHRLKPKTLGERIAEKPTPTPGELKRRIKENLPK